MDDLTIYRGDKASFDLTVTHDDGSPVDLTDGDLTWVAKANRADTTALGPVTLAVGADPTLGLATLTIPASVTAALANEYAVYLWEVEFDDGVTDPVVVAAGVLTVLPSVT